MIYRCRTCGWEEARGCLPTVSCGLYLMFLMAVAMCCEIGALRLVRGWVRVRPPEGEPPDRPWWLWVASVPVALVLAVGGMVALKYLLELVEYLMFARRRCPACGGRRWSWGFTRGFGL